MPILSDTPISTRTEDSLGRVRFSDELAKAILDWRSEESIVVGLLGSWGSGKTSVLRMANEALVEVTKSQPDSPTVVWFDPWNFADQDRLIGSFFRELLLALGKDGRDARLATFAADLKAYVGLLAPVALASGFVPPIAVAGFVAAVSAWVIRLWRKRNRWEDLESIRRRLDEYMGQRKSKVIVIIDNIDRLNKTEIRQIFQLVKLTADFPNTVYLLAFDRLPVLEALSQEYGAEFLEKIIQMPLDIPKARPELLRDAFLSEAHEAVATCGTRLELDLNELADRYDAGLSVYIETLRDMKRLINAVYFNLPQIASDVNPSDFVLMEALRVHEPEVHRNIWSKKSIYTEAPRSGVQSENERILRSYGETMEAVPSEKRASISKLIEKLFPGVDAVRSGYGLVGYQDLWKEELRVCSERHFDTYFVLALPPEQVSRMELDRIIATTGSPTEFRRMLRDFVGTRRLRDLMIMMDVHYELVPLENVESTCLVLLDMGDFAPHSDVFFGLDTNLYLIRVVSRLIRRLTDWIEAASRLCEATSSIYTPVRWIRMEEDELEHERRSDDQKDQLRTVGDVLARRIRILAEQTTLLGSPRLMEVLYSWAHWESIEVVRDYISSLRRDDFKTAGFLLRLLSIGWASDGRKTEMTLKLVIPEPLATHSDVSDMVNQLTEELLSSLGSDYRDKLRLVRQKLEQGDYRIAGQ